MYQSPRLHVKYLAVSLISKIVSGKILDVVDIFGSFIDFNCFYVFFLGGTDKISEKTRHLHNNDFILNRLFIL